MQLGGQSPNYIDTKTDHPPNVEHLSQGERILTSPECKVATVDPFESLKACLELCENIDQFEALVEGHPAGIVEEAIALQDTQPRRNQLRDWYEIISANSTVDVNSQIADLKSEGLPRLESDDPTVASGEKLAQEGEALDIHPALSAYKEGDSVWAYFPQSQNKWLRATVAWVRDRLIRVEAGSLGMLIEIPQLIAPGDWELVI